MDTISVATWRPPASVPREHGFWVLLVASLGVSLLRSRGALPALAVTAVLALNGVVCAAAIRRSVRRSSALQLLAAVLLGFAGVPVELAGGLAGPSVVAAAVMRAVVFGACVLVVRAALASSAKDGARRSRLLYAVACASSVTSMLAFAALGRAPEAAGCALTATAVVLSVGWQPTAKQLRPLGWGMTALAVIALALEVT